jgi:hypothetical protein
MPEAPVDRRRGAAQAAVPVEPMVRRVYRWDLDKTYLKSEFATFTDLIRSAFEGAEKKQSVPGAAALLRELKKGEGVRVCFISGSPRQMRRVLARKLQLDGVEFDEFILKPNLGNLFRGRFRALREQVGYKLPALLAGRSGLPAAVRETCFGDDSEADAFVYSLYADLLAERVDRALLERILDAARVYPDDAARTLALYESAPRGDCVDRILIHLDLRSPTARFDRYGPRLVPIYNYFQAALVLLEDGLLDVEAAIRVALEMVDRFDYTLEALRNSMQDLLRRGRLRRETPVSLGRGITDGIDRIGPLGSLPAARDVLTRFASRVEALAASPGGTLSSVPPELPIDYVAAFAEDVPRRNR